MDQNVEKKQGLEQDHFYQRSEENSTANPPPKRALDIKQEKAKRYPLPDGSIPPADANTSVSQQQDVFSHVSLTEPQQSPLSGDHASSDDALEPASSGRTSIPDPAKEVLSQSLADRAGKLQRQAENQIPSESAGPPPRPLLKSRYEIEGQNVFYKPSQETSPLLSSLPRDKLPKITEDRQEGDNGQINQDVFYSSMPRDQNSMFDAQAASDQEQLPEDMHSEIFQSPRVARMLGAKHKSGETRRELDPDVQQATAAGQTKSPLHKTQELFNGSSTSKVHSSSKRRHGMSEKQQPLKTADDEEIQQLAADMAKDSDSGASVAAAVSLQKG